MGCRSLLCPRMLGPPLDLNQLPQCPLVQDNQRSGKGQPLTRWRCGRKDSLASYSTPAARKQCPTPPLRRYSKLVILPCCHGTSHVAPLGPQDCQASPAGLANRSSSGLGAVKLSRHRTVSLGAHNMAMSPNCRLLNQLPGQNPSSTVSQSQRGRSHRKEQQAATRTTIFSSYHSSTRHCVRCPKQASIVTRDCGWTVPRARYLHDRYACMGFYMREEPATGNPGTSLHPL